VPKTEIKQKTPNKKINRSIKCVFIDSYDVYTAVQQINWPENYCFYFLSIRTNPEEYPSMAVE